MAECLSELNPTEFKSLLNGLALMSQLYWGPTPELCRELTDPALVEEVMELSAVLGAGSGQTAQNLLGTIRSAETPEALFDSLESAYISLFVNDRGGVAAPLYQSFYDSPEGTLMGRPALMMRQRLEAAGIDLAAQTSEPADHLAVELEYLFLLLEQAYIRDDPSLLSDAREFSSKELLPWLEALRGRIPDSEPGRLYAVATDLLLTMIRLTAACV